MNNLSENETANILWSQYGEVLKVVDSSDIDMKRLTKILEQPICKPRFRLFLLNPDETINYEIPENDFIINSGSFSENYQNGQRKALNISLVNIDKKYTPSINTIWVQDKFRLDVGIEYQGEIYWFQRGIYVLENPSSVHNDSDKQITYNMADKFALLEGKTGTLESTYEIPVGSDVKRAIEGILSLDNGMGSPIDTKPIIYDSVYEDYSMPYTLSKDAGSTLGEMLLEIGTFLNAEIYYNSQGNLCIVSINETTLDIQKATLWDYDEEKGLYFGATTNYDFENAINEVQVVGDPINEYICWALVQNTNPLSPLCVQRIGRRIEYINDSNICWDYLAEERANYELRKHGILKTTITIKVAFNPLLFVNNLVSITDEFYNFNREKFLIQSISYNLSNDSQMSITCSNIINFNKLNIV